jgi:hypothetical protein
MFVSAGELALDHTYYTRVFCVAHAEGERVLVVALSRRAVRGQPDPAGASQDVTIYRI